MDISIHSCRRAFDLGIYAQHGRLTGLES